MAFFSLIQIVTYRGHKVNKLNGFRLFYIEKTQ